MKKKQAAALLSVILLFMATKLIYYVIHLNLGTRELLFCAGCFLFLFGLALMRIAKLPLPVPIIWTLLSCVLLSLSQNNLAIYRILSVILLPIAVSFLMLDAYPALSEKKGESKLFLLVQLGPLLFISYLIFVMIRYKLNFDLSPFEPLIGGGFDFAWFAFPALMLLDGLLMRVLRRHCAAGDIKPSAAFDLRQILLFSMLMQAGTLVFLKMNQLQYMAYPISMLWLLTLVFLHANGNPLLQLALRDGNRLLRTFLHTPATPEEATGDET